MHLAVAVLVPIKCCITIVDVGCHVVVDNSLEEADLAIVDLPTIMAGATTVERLCLEAGGDHQVAVVSLCHKEMAIAIIVANMVTLKESVIKSKMTHKEVEAAAGHSILIFISMVVNMAIKDMIEVVIYLPCNKNSFPSTLVRPTTKHMRVNEEYAE